MLERVDFFGAVEDTLVLGFAELVVFGGVLDFARVLDFGGTLDAGVLLALEPPALEPPAPVNVCPVPFVDSGLGPTLPSVANAVSEKVQHANTNARANTKYRTVFFLCT